MDNSWIRPYGLHWAQPQTLVMGQVFDFPDWNRHCRQFYYVTSDDTSLVVRHLRRRSGV